jgi:hypothetical protein
MNTHKLKRISLRLLRLGAALFVAGVFSWRQPRVAVVKIWRAATFWARFVRKHERAEFWTTYRRYRACRECPVFHGSLRTCGSPLADDPELGCNCQMETKCGIKDAQCWLIENDYDISGSHNTRWR